MGEAGDRATAGACDQCGRCVALDRSLAGMQEGEAGGKPINHLDGVWESRGGDSMRDRDNCRLLVFVFLLLKLQVSRCLRLFTTCMCLRCWSRCDVLPR